MPTLPCKYCGDEVEVSDTAEKVVCWKCLAGRMEAMRDKINDKANKPG